MWPRERQGPRWKERQPGRIRGAQLVWPSALGLESMRPGWPGRSWSPREAEPSEKLSVFCGKDIVWKSWSESTVSTQQKVFRLVLQQLDFWLPPHRQKSRGFPLVQKLWELVFSALPQVKMPPATIKPLRCNVNRYSQLAARGATTAPPHSLGAVEGS